MIIQIRCKEIDIGRTQIQTHMHSFLYIQRVLQDISICAVRCADKYYHITFQHKQHESNYIVFLYGKYYYILWCDTKSKLIPMCIAHKRDSSLHLLQAYCSSVVYSNIAVTCLTVVILFVEFRGLFFEILPVEIC